MYGRIYVAAYRPRAQGSRRSRGGSFDRRYLCCAAELPLYTRNPDDFRGLETLIDVICV